MTESTKDTTPTYESYGIKESSEDISWLQATAEKGWVGITRDARIFYDEDNEERIYENECKLVIMTQAGHLGPMEQSEMMSQVMDTLNDYSENLEGPWVVTITPHPDGSDLPVQTKLYKKAHIPDLFREANDAT